MKNLVIDGNSLLNRSFYGLVSLTNGKGQGTGGIFGFLTTLEKLKKEEKPDSITVTFDLKAPTFRHLSYPEYKAGRHKMPEELVSQFPLLKEILSAMNLPSFSVEGFEADDLIGTIARIDQEAGWETVIVTGDRDALQLVTDLTTVCYLSSGKGGMKRFTPALFDETYGFPPLHLVDFKGIMGDSSDNIPGIRGIGEKTALPLIQKHHSLEKIYELLEDPEETLDLKKGALAKLRGGKDMATMSYDLALIRREVPLDFHPAEYLIQEFDKERLISLLQDLDLHKFIDAYGLREMAAEEEGWLAVPMVEQKNTLSQFLDLMENWKGETLAVLALPELSGIALHHQEPELGRCVMMLEHSFDDYGTMLKELFSADVKLMVYHSKVLAFQLLSEGIVPDNIVFDVQLAAYLLAPDVRSYDLEDLVRKYCHASLIEADAFLSENAFSPLSDPEVALEAFASHCGALDVLGRMLPDLLEKQGLTSLYQEIELPLSGLLARMEQHGISLDSGKLRLYGEKLSTRLEELEKGIYEEAGEEFNIASPKQVGVILFEKMELPPVKKTKTGYSTNVEVLEKLREDHPQHQILGMLLEQRQLSKLHATYVKGLLNVVSPEGKVHSSFQNTVTATGRLSSTEPNLQNIPIRTPLGAELREMFVASEGRVLVDADYSQIELRLLAHMAEDENMIAAFLSGQDFHTQTASQVFHVPLEEVTGEMRRSAKAVNFGIVYGMSAFSLSQDIGVTVAEAKHYIGRYFATYSQVKIYLETVVAEGKKQGFVSTLYGRKRWVPELSSSNFQRRSGAERIAQNTPIQGTAADVMKLAMLAVDRRLQKEGSGAFLVLQVHDEIILDCPAEEGAQVAQWVSEEMEAVGEFAVPLLTETHVGNTWGEAH
ncbi:MAG: DNA polymerase I [Eubacteriales bacterium]